MKESIFTCSVCGNDYIETDVNIVDYDLDVCVECEKTMKENNTFLKE